MVLSCWLYGFFLIFFYRLSVFSFGRELSYLWISLIYLKLKKKKNHTNQKPPCFGLFRVDFSLGSFQDLPWMLSLSAPASWSWDVSQPWMKSRNYTVYNPVTWSFLTNYTLPGLMESHHSMQPSLVWRRPPCIFVESFLCVARSSLMFYPTDFNHSAPQTQLFFSVQQDHPTLLGVFLFESWILLETQNMSTSGKPGSSQGFLIHIPSLSSQKYYTAFGTMSEKKCSIYFVHFSCCLL